MDRYSADIRYGLRQLRFNPIFTLVAVLSLALGIGANTAIFQLINAIRLRSLPVANPQELAYLDYAPHLRRGAGGPLAAPPSLLPIGKVSASTRRRFPMSSLGALTPLTWSPKARRDTPKASLLAETSSASSGLAPL